LLALSIHLFGGVFLTGATRRMVEVAVSAAPIIGYLVLKRHRPVPRAELAGQLWPDREDARARRCLSTALWRLNQEEGAEDLVVGTTHDSLGINWARARWVDVISFERRCDELLVIPPEKLDSLQYHRLARTVALYRDDLLRQIDMEWVQLERQRLRNRYLDALHHLTLAATARGLLNDAIAFGRRLSALEPLREDAHRLLMRIYEGAGNRGKAIEQYRICQGELSSELGVTPTEETRALYTSLIKDLSGILAPSVAEVQNTALAAMTSRVRSARRAIAAADVRLVDALALAERVARVPTA
jgi:DNA-binding SARP family transcriptional activator